MTIKASNETGRHDDEPAVQAAMQRGVRGFISTSLPIEIAIAGLRLVLVGGAYRPLPVAGMNRIPDFEPPDARGLVPAYLTNEGARMAIDRRSVTDLTPREQQVLAELELGLPNKLIAAKLGLSESTVKMHIQHIMGLRKIRGLGVCAAGIPIRRLFDVIAGVHVHVGTFRLVGWVEGNDGSLETAVTAISDTP